LKELKLKKCYGNIQKNIQNQFQFAISHTIWINEVKKVIFLDKKKFNKDRPTTGMICKQNHKSSLAISQVVNQ